MSEESTLKPIEVQLPVVRLRVEDLAYLRGLATDGVKCSIPHRNGDRLRVLGLIEDKELPPCPKEMRSWSVGVRDARSIILREAKADEPDWEKISNASYAARRAKPASRKTVAITKSGLKLVQNGTATVQIRKGCK